MAKTTREFAFTCGDKVREKITGFAGTITGVAFYITGCNSYLVAAKPKDEFSEPVSLYFDEGRLELVEDKVVVAEDVRAGKNGNDKLPPGGRRGA